jgi:hypothetical protein
MHDERRIQPGNAHQASQGIDLDELTPFRDAVAFFPRQANGKRIHIATLYRYATRGLNGVVLWSCQAGNTRATTRKAVATFFSELTARRRVQGSSTPHPAAEEVGRRLRLTRFEKRNAK